MAWIPTESEKGNAVALCSALLRTPEDEQLDVLALLVNLWCYHQKMKREQAHAA